MNATRIPVAVVTPDGVNGQASIPTASTTPDTSAIELQRFDEGRRVVDGDPAQRGREPQADQDADQDPDAIKRQLLLAKLRDDRADLVRVANAVREVAETVETAQDTLAFARRSLRWLLLAGSAAALTLWLTNGRRPRSALFVGLSMQMAHRWLKPASRTMPSSRNSRLPAPADRRARAA